MTTDYPEEEDLQKIRDWEDLSNPKGLIDFVCSIWHWGEDQYKLSRVQTLKEDKIQWHFELHTGGWSGNEEIIGALMESKSIFWLLYWRKSEVGGHYYFEINKSVQAIKTN